MTLLFFVISLALLHCVMWAVLRLPEKYSCYCLNFLLTWKSSRCCAPFNYGITKVITRYVHPQEGLEDEIGSRVVARQKLKSFMCLFNANISHNNTPLNTLSKCTVHACSPCLWHPYNVTRFAQIPHCFRSVGQCYGWQIYKGAAELLHFKSAWENQFINKFSTNEKQISKSAVNCISDELLTDNWITNTNNNKIIRNTNQVSLG